MKRMIQCTVLSLCSLASAAQTEPPTAPLLKASGLRGGLLVHLGCGSGELTAELGADASVLVHGLDTDPERIGKARAHFRSLGLNGRVSAALFDGHRLPYTDNLVNLIILSGDECRVSREELLRVLVPGGTVMTDTTSSVLPVGRGRGEEGIPQWTKPWPTDIDEWTHYLHGPDNNAVAEDSTIGPPRHFQWISGPRFSRSHDHLASVSAVVSAGGRLFSILDEGSTAFVAAAPRWKLIAQDAFNGIKLWERGIMQWEYHLRDFRSGPADIARRLVAVGNRVYATLGYGEPVVALDAATGRTLQTYTATAGTREILYDNDTLLLVLGEPHASWGAAEAREIVSQQDYSPPFENYTPPAHAMRIAAVSATTGKTKWTNTDPYTRDLMPSTLTCSGGHVFFQTLDDVVCLNAENGQLLWKAPRAIHRHRLAWSTPTLVAHDGIVFSADRGAAKTEGSILWIPSGGYHQYIRGDDAKGELVAYDAETGTRLWSCPVYEGFNSPVDVLITGDLLWTGRYAEGKDPGMTQARDIRTGEVRRERPADQTFLPRIGHARCHRAKATTEYLILGRRGIEFVDIETGGMTANMWVRGICQYGVMPANGLLYAPPHACACNVGDMLKSGYLALAPKLPSDSEDSPTPPALDKGPAYGFVPGQPQGTADCWPTYRHDARRSGYTPAGLPATLKRAWKAQIGGRLTSPVVAGGILLVAASDQHTVHALDAATGKPRWEFVAGARIDSPPTINAGRVLFGSADGRVTCLRLSDGKRIWAFRAAPRDRLIAVNGQLESVWPVSGSVLVSNNDVYVAAGRNSYLDGGIYLYKLNAETGNTLLVKQLEIEQEKRDAGIASGGYLPDVLSSDGESIFMRSTRFSLALEPLKENVPHLWSSVGFLDHSWWHRTYWQVGTSMQSGWSGWTRAGRTVPAGRILVTDGRRVFGYGRNQYDIPGAHVGVDGRGAWGPIGKGLSPWTYYRFFGRELKGQPGDLDWSQRIPVLAQALLLAGDTLFVAGPEDPVGEVPHKPSDVDPIAEALTSDHGGRLLALSSTDGKALSNCELESPPVFDGMIAAEGRLYLATRAGQVICME